MTQDRISATVDPEVKEQLERQNVNASGLVNKLLNEYFNTDGDSEEMLQLRKEQIKSEIERHESQITALKDDLERVQKRLSNIRDAKQSTLEEANEVLDTVPKEPDNAAIQHWANELNMQPTELISELQDDE